MVKPSSSAIFSTAYLKLDDTSSREMPIATEFELLKVLSRAGLAALGSMADWGLETMVEAARRKSTSQFVRRSADQLLTE